MVGLVLDELRKLKRSWVLLVSPLLFLLAPLLGVFTAKTNSDRAPDKIQFDFATIFTQVQLDNALLIAPLLMGTVGIYLVHREYQERTLASLLTIPIKLSRLVGAKSILVLAFGVLGALLEAVATVPLSLVVGSPPMVWTALVGGTVGLVVGNALVLPCVLLLVIVVLVSRNYLLAIAFCFGSIVFGMVALNLPELCPYVPWVAPTLLSVDAKELERFGLEGSQWMKAAATYAVFFVGVFAGLLMTMERQSE